MKSKISYYRQNQSGFLSLKSSLFTAGVILATASMGTAVVAQTMTVPSSNISAASGTGFCVTAELEDDPSIFAQRGNCGTVESEPGIEIPDDQPAIINYCTPETLELVQMKSDVYADPRYPEYQKYFAGYPYDSEVMDDWWANRPVTPNIETMTGDVEHTYYDANAYVLKQAQSLAESYPAQPAGLLPVEMLNRMPEISKNAMVDFCATYKGPTPYLSSEPRYNNNYGPARLHGTTGSTEPIVLKYSFDYSGNPAFPKQTPSSSEGFEFKVNKPESLPGYASSKSTQEVVNGKLIFTETLIPGASGWGSSDEIFDMSVTVDRKNANGNSSPKTLDAQIRVNNNTLSIVPPGPTPTPHNPDYLDQAPGYIDLGASWDNHITHSNSKDVRAGDSLNYSIQRGNGDVEPEYYENRVAILENTRSTLYPGANYDIESGRGYVNFTGPNATGSYSSKVQLLVIDPNTFAQSTHVFTRQVIDAKSGEKPRSFTVTPFEDHINPGLTTTSYIILNDGYFRADYDIEVNYAGETCLISGVNSCSLSPILSDGSTGYLALSPQNSERRLMKLAGVLDDSLPGEVELKYIYKPTGDTTTLKVNVR